MMPLIEDEYIDAPKKRVLEYARARKAEGRPVVGLYCCYAPLELIWAMNGVVVTLCGQSNKPIRAAEAVLPANLCPMVKSSYGFIVTDTCSYFKLSDVILAETTCDGKKKMFELVKDVKPFHVLQLPQIPDDPESLVLWTAEFRKLKNYFEDTFACVISDEAIEAAIKEGNIRRKLLMDIADFAALDPPLIRWDEMTDLKQFGLNHPGPEIQEILKSVLDRLDERRKRGEAVSDPGAPRVMVTGCPVGGDAEKIFQVIEEAGGVVVAQEACSGLKPVLGLVEEGTGDPLTALAKRYLKLPCSVMSPNPWRFELVDQLVRRFKPDVAVDFILTACHTYNVESHQLKNHIVQNHGLPFLKVETDYSEGDVGPLRLRVEALLEMTRSLEDDAP